MTRADLLAGCAATFPGCDGGTAVSGVTAGEWADSGPAPFGLTAVTVNV